MGNQQLVLWEMKPSRCNAYQIKYARDLHQDANLVCMYTYVHYVYMNTHTVILNFTVVVGRILRRLPKFLVSGYAYLLLVVHAKTILVVAAKGFGRCN